MCGRRDGCRNSTCCSCTLLAVRVQMKVRVLSCGHLSPKMQRNGGDSCPWKMKEVRAGQALTKIIIASSRAAAVAALLLGPSCSCSRERLVSVRSEVPASRTKASSRIAGLKESTSDGVAGGAASHVVCGDEPRSCHYV